MYAFRPADASRWFKMTVDGRGVGLGETTGIALDPQGNPQICFTPGPLKYSSFDGHVWKTQSIGTSSMPLEYTCSIAVSSDGAPHIIWYQVHNSDGTLFMHIRYAVKQDAVWLARTVDFDFETGKWNSIVLDKTGIPHLSYSSLSGGELRYATLNSDKWEISIIDSRNFRDKGSFNRGFGSSIVLDRDDNPEISYYNDNLLKFARRVDGKWKTEIVSQVLGGGGWSTYHSSILIDHYDNVHICFEDSGAVKHATWDGSKWQIQVITPGGSQSRWPSMTIDGNDTLYIAYRDSQDGSLKVSIGAPSNLSEKPVGTPQANF
jgi:hypothetical protein